jgi:hypothetical protein
MPNYEKLQKTMGKYCKKEAPKLKKIMKDSGPKGEGEKDTLFGIGRCCWHARCSRLAGSLSPGR